jgi:glycosyltransferase involved in cell wall biosynthesis
VRPKSDRVRHIHVALITPGFPRDEADTACIPALQEYLDGVGRYAPHIHFSVLTLRYPHSRELYSWRGQGVFPSDGRQRRFPLIVPGWRDLARNFRRLLRQEPVHVIHSLWLGECALLGTFLSRFYGIPHVITLMGQEARLRKRYLWLLDRKRNNVVTLSDFQRGDLPARNRDKARVIPWGIDPLPLRAGGQRDVDVLGVGSLTQVKAFDKFLRVVAILKTAKPALRCVIAGDGPERPKLERLSQELGLESVVRFEGAVKRERVLELMAKSRALLHTSRYESYGFVFAEALASGARIVSGAVGIAQAGPDWAVEESVPAMAAAVERFLALPDAQPSIPYPVEQTVCDYATLYGELI